MQPDITTLVRRYIRELELPIVETSKIDNEKLLTNLKGYDLEFIMKNNQVELVFNSEEKVILNPENYKLIINNILIRIAQDDRFRNQNSVS